MDIAGHTITPKQLAALHGLYRGLMDLRNGKHVLYGVNVSAQLNALADRKIIARTAFDYMIPYDSPGANIIDATPDFPINANL